MIAGGQDGVAVIGAGSSGLAAVKALARCDFPVVCFERGSAVGGNWRYQNDSGTSAAYASLRCNVSRRRMQYPSFPMPRSYGDFPSHTDMAAYLDAYTDAFRLRRHIRFATRVERVEPSGDGTWRVTALGGETTRHSAVVVAHGHHWEPRWPDLAGASTAQLMHAHDYRVPDPLAGKRVLVIGAGQSAVEIATEASRVAAQTLISVRTGTHVLPRYILGRPFDLLDVDLVNRLPWTFLNWLTGRLVRLARREDPAAYGFRPPRHRVLDQVPAVSSDLLPALRSGALSARPEVERVDGSTVAFVDGTRAEIDMIVCATGYRLTLPFLSPAVLAPRGMALPLYRRIVPPDVPGLYFIGLVDAPAGLLPIVERQSAWLADVLLGRIALPDRVGMMAAIDAAERRTVQRFPAELPHSIRCDPHAYLRLLARDRLLARLRRLVQPIADRQSLQSAHEVRHHEGGGTGELDRIDA
jgi:cation diffusion facilitator CzcD-associated flavoprotein CzcO